MIEHIYLFLSIQSTSLLLVNACMMAIRNKPGYIPRHIHKTKTTVTGNINFEFVKKEIISTTKTNALTAIPITKSILEIIRTAATGCFFVLFKKDHIHSRKQRRCHAYNTKPENDINNTG